MESKKLRVLAASGMLAAVGYVLQLFEFPLLPAASFLKFDFGDVAVALAGWAMGPAAAVLTALVKGILWGVIGHGADGWVGAGMNTVTVLAFALPFAFFRQEKKLRGPVLAAVLGIACMTAVMAGVNLAVDPWYFKMPFAAVRALVVSAIIPFNLLRGLINGTATAVVALAFGRTPLFHHDA